MTDEHTENFAQMIAALKDEYDVREPQIADAINVHVSTVNTWASGKRGAKRGPRTEHLRALAKAYPAFSLDRIFAAVQRQAPGPLDPAAEERILELYRGLTEEQRRSKEIEMRALNEANRSGQ